PSRHLVRYDLHSFPTRRSSDLSLASLVSNRQSGKLIDESLTSTSRVLPDTKLSELQRSTPAYTAQILARLPEPIRQKFAAKMWQDRKSTRLNSSHVAISYAVFC